MAPTKSRSAIQTASAASGGGSRPAKRAGAGAGAGGRVGRSRVKKENEENDELTVVSDHLVELDENIMPEEGLTSGNRTGEDDDDNIASDLRALSTELPQTDDTEANVAAVAMAAAAAAVGYPGAVVVPTSVAVSSTSAGLSRPKPVANNKLLISRRSYSRSEYSHEGKTADDYNEQGILRLCLTYDHHNTLRVKIPTRCVYCPLRSCRENFNSSKQAQRHYDDVHSQEMGLGLHYDVRAERRLMTVEEKRKADSVTRRRAKKSTLYTPPAHCLDLQREIRRRAFQISKTVQEYCSLSPIAALNDIRSRWRFLCMRKQHLEIIEFLRTTIPFYIAVQLNSAIQSNEDMEKLELLFDSRTDDEFPLLWNDLHWTGNRVTGFRNACYAYHYLCTGQLYRSYNYYELPANSFQPVYNVTVPRILLRDIPLYSARYGGEYGTKPDVLLDAEGERSFEEFKLNITNMVNINSYFKENIKIILENRWTMLPSVESVPESAKTLRGVQSVKDYLVKNNMPSTPKYLDDILNGTRDPISYEPSIVEPYSVAVANAMNKAATMKHPRRLFNGDEDDLDMDVDDEGNDQEDQSIEDLNHHHHHGPNDNFYPGDLVDVTSAAVAAAAAAATIVVNSSSNSLALNLPAPKPVDSKKIDPSLQGAGHHHDDTATDASTHPTPHIDNDALSTLLQAVDEENKRKRDEDFDRTTTTTTTTSKRHHRSRKSKRKHH